MVARACSGSPHLSGPVVETAGARLLRDAAAGRAWHQVPTDGEGLCRFRFRDPGRKRNVVSVVHEVCSGRRWPTGAGGFLSSR